jgi:hypothetical protein
MFNITLYIHVVRLLSNNPYCFERLDMKLRHSVANCTRFATQDSIAKNKGGAVSILTLATSPHSFPFVIFSIVSCGQFLFPDFCFFDRFIPCFSPPTLVACTLFDPVYRSSSPASRKAGPIPILVHQYHSPQCTSSSRRL